MSYDPTIGRWMEEDPEGYIDGPNMYPMERGNPIKYVDPTGLDPSLDPRGLGLTPEMYNGLVSGAYSQVPSPPPTTQPSPPPATRPSTRPSGGPAWQSCPPVPKTHSNWWGNSIVYNDSSGPVLIWYTGGGSGGYGILGPGQHTPINEDGGDWVYYGGQWYKVTHPQTAHLDDNNAPYIKTMCTDGKEFKQPLGPGPDRKGWQPGMPPWPLPVGLK